MIITIILLAVLAYNVFVAVKYRRQCSRLEDTLESKFEVVKRLQEELIHVNSTKDTTIKYLEKNLARSYGKIDKLAEENKRLKCKLCVLDKQSNDEFSKFLDSYRK